MAFVRYYVGDVVKMKKSHPCGSDEWEVNWHRLSHRM